ncbi:hypothetical protein KFL_000310350 [Klebsormidium nitens]|uniref:Transmembrane protein n=1 Tax=Klebsormidium nitens TaxID=105231 RepID=A0A1Y1HLJ1_KLENI|nr:hypothetical protein KFL_000310350 [Klebsormidium nitens]|eukprot:GAQ79485.1 hypothetical protein KFL_000310350 [Klebsormidium nitens]
MYMYRDLRGLDLVGNRHGVTTTGHTAASLALTSLIGVLLFRSARRRAKRATGVRVRSDREEVVDLLAEAKANSLESVNPKIPSLPASKQDSEASQKKNPLSVLSGAVVAGVIAAGLWLFTTKVEAVFDAQRLSTDYQIRQISITVRTIVVGLAYLSTFVFAFNSVGLVLYAGQLALGLDEEGDKQPKKKEALVAEKESKGED